MTGALVRKLLRDVRWALLVTMVLIFAFQCLWAKVTQRIISELLPAVTPFIPLMNLKEIVFKGPGKLMQTFMGGENIQLEAGLDMISIGYVHPLMQTIFCIWAIGRAAGAIAGEIDRGTMELLLAQPVARWRVVAAHLAVDAVVIPLLCLSLWAGNWVGTALVGMLQVGAPRGPFTVAVDPFTLAPALTSVAALIFAISGTTMALSAAGRFRGRVMGVAVLATLLQFLVNVLGQLWDAVAPLRQFTIFYYFQPQPIILGDRWLVETAVGYVSGVAVMLGVGALGYALAFWAFCRRDLPAPL